LQSKINNDDSLKVRAKGNRYVRISIFRISIIEIEGYSINDVSKILRLIVFILLSFLILVFILLFLCGEKFFLALKIIKWFELFNRT